MSDRKQSLNSVAAQGRALQEKVDNIKSWVAKAEVDMLSTHPDGSQQADEHKQMIMEERRNYREELGRTRQLLQGQLLALQEDSVVNESRELLDLLKEVERTVNAACLASHNVL